MAKPRSGTCSRQAEEVASKKSKSKGPTKGVSKKPFKRTVKQRISLVNKPALSVKKSEQVLSGGGGVKRSREQEAEKPTKRVKVSAPPTQKDRRAFRKSQRPNSELSNKSKVIWERLRRHDLSKEGRVRLMDELMELLSGNFYQLSLKHDTARIVQCCLKNGTAAQRTAIFNEVSEHVLELCKLKYAKFTLKALLKYCSSVERDRLIAGLYGHVRKLIRHLEASEIVEIAYNDWANAQQRGALIQEFYGPSFALFKPKTVESGPPPSLEQVLANNSDHREAILKHLKEALLPLLDKSVVKHSIVHRVVLDYLLNCQDKDRTEMIELLREVLVTMLHTKEGSKVTLQCLWHGTAKERKLIVKSFKSFVRKICLEENGHVVLMGLFDCVDDTVLVKKALLSEIVTSLEEVCDDQFGRHIILYLLSPRSPCHFSPQFVDLLTPGDGNGHSKKLASVRAKELVVGVAQPLIELATKKACDWARSKSHAPLLLQVAESFEGQYDLCPLYDVLVEDVVIPVSGENHLVVHPCGHWVIKRLLTGPREAGTNKGLTDKEGFKDCLLKRLSVESLQSWVGTNRGSFVVCSLLQGASVEVKGRLSSMLEPVMCSLLSGTLKGQLALCNELART